MKRAFWYSLFAANILVIGGLWWSGSSDFFLAGGSQRLVALGRLAGLLGQYLILVQLVLVGRIQLLEQAFGHDKLLKPHRWVGYSIGPVLLSHPFFLAVGYAGSLDGAWKMFTGFLSASDDIVKALIGLILFVVIVAFSLPPVRRRLRYETWYGVHLLIYAAIALVFTHQINGTDLRSTFAGSYWLVLNFGVFGLFLLYRFLRPLFLFWRHRFTVEKVVPESGSVNSVYIRGRSMEKFKYQAGQFCNIYFAQRGFWWSHPFSLSKAYDGQSIRFSIKNSGDFTSRIKEIKPGTKVIIDGPLGTFTERSSARDKYLLIAGGIGITPIRSLAESLSRGGKDVQLLYSARTAEDLVLRSELDSFKIKRYYILSDEERPGLAHGMLTGEKIAGLVPDWSEREVYICGPGPMMRALSVQLQSLGLPKAQIHYEEFVY